MDKKQELKLLEALVEQRKKEAIDQQFFTKAKFLTDVSGRSLGTENQYSSDDGYSSSKSTTTTIFKSGKLEVRYSVIHEVDSGPAYKDHSSDSDTYTDYTDYTNVDISFQGNTVYSANKFNDKSEYISKYIPGNWERQLKKVYSEFHKKEQKKSERSEREAEKERLDTLDKSLKEAIDRLKGNFGV